jgi:hypothetical protein
MALRYVLDENLRGPFWAAMRRANARRALPLEIACVGEEIELPLGISDPEFLVRDVVHVVKVDGLVLGLDSARSPTVKFP